MTRGELRGLFWEVIGEASNFGAQPGYASGPTADQYIWQGFCEIGKRTKPPHWRKLHSITLVASTETYALPADWLAYQDPVRSPLTVSRRRLQYVEPTVVEQLRGDSAWSALDPAYWYDAGVADSGGSFGSRLVGVFPATLNGTGLLPYVRKPIKLTHASMSDGTEYPDLVEPLHKPAVFWGVYEFFLHQPELPQSVSPDTYLAIFDRMVPA